MSSTLISTEVHGLHSAPVLIDHVSKTFTTKSGEVHVLADINLSIASGEIIALLGPSGCGKSTLLRLIAGLDHPTTGSVAVNGVHASGINALTSVVFQEPRLLPWRNVLQNVELGLRGEKAPSKAAEWLEIVGLASFAKSYPKQISGGMAGRVSLARALISDPKVLLLDEPLAALDALTRLQMQDLIADVVAKTGVTVVLVTHDIDEAIYLADRVVVLGERGEPVRGEYQIPGARPRDRKDPELTNLMSALYAQFGIHA